MPLLISGIITISCSVFLFILDSHRLSARYKPFFRQTITGIVLGLCAVFATEFGSFEVFGAALNVRDAAPICSGLLFGPWSGILTGLIGGIERYLAAFHGVGVYTQIACSVACIFAGFLSAVFKQFLFKKHRPTILHSVVITLLTEAVHMGLVPLTNLEDLPQASVVMSTCFVPLVVSNILCVAIVFLIVSIVIQKTKGYSFRQMIHRKDLFFTHDLFFSFQFWLLLIVIICFGASTMFSTIVYDQMVKESITEKRYGEIDAVGSLTIMRSETQKIDMVQSATEVADIWNQQALENEQENYLFLLLVDPEDNQLSSTTGFDEAAIIDSLNEYEPYELYRLNVKKYSSLTNERLIIMYTEYNNYKLVMFSLEKYELYLPHLSTAITSFVQIAIFALLMLCIFLLLKKLVGQNLGKINRSLEEITAGNLNERVNVYSHKEFATLSDSINQTVDKLKEYIDQEANRFKEEFELAHQIQISALPSVFPAFPDHKELDIYATYQPAKDVGGDFYDFYFLDKENLAFLIADVSGKGIPAAMFMMRAKTAIRAFAEQKLNVGSVMQTVNDYLCTNNEVEMFVTCWFGILNVKTGVLNYSCAGHNPPMICRKDGTLSYLNSKAGLVLGAMKGLPYHSEKTEIMPGESLFLYTDGLTEANNLKYELYGEERLLKFVDSVKSKNCVDLCVAVKNDIDGFVGEAQQADDMTMLVLQYIGDEEVNSGHHEFEITVESKLDNQKRVTAMIEETLHAAGAPIKIQSQLNVVVDELYSNICKYGYEDDQQLITVSGLIDLEETPEDKEKKFVKLTFIDTANRFNPIDVAAPDITLTAEEREIGGLGIFMVRNIMDDVFYEYRNGANRLTVVKYFD